MTAEPEDLQAEDAAQLLACHTQVLELVAGGAGLAEMLGCITTGLERLLPDSRCSILLLDDEGRTLRHGSAPSLPADYLAAIDGLPVGPSAGSCGTAAWSGRRVVAEDIETDLRWAPFRATARASGLRSCWSTPITGRTAGPVGTFAVYHPYVHRPEAREERLVDRLTYLAAVAMEQVAAQRERRARREAEVARRTAEQHSRATSDFFTGVNHEMRTPLQAITGFTELLKTLDLDEARRAEALDHIAAAAGHLLALVDDTLDLARLGAQMLPLSPQPVDLGTAVCEVTRLLAPLAGGDGVNLVAAPTGGQVIADPRRLRQILINLVTNGIRYGEPGGTVTVSSTSKGSRIRIDVRDDGPGIPADRLDRLFRPFDRLGIDDVRDTSAPGGSGLGLTVARGLAEAMSGSLTITSVEGQGTVARLELPAATRSGLSSSYLRP